MMFTIVYLILNMTYVALRVHSQGVEKIISLHYGHFGKLVAVHFKDTMLFEM